MCMYLFIGTGTYIGLYMSATPHPMNILLIHVVIHLSSYSFIYLFNYFIYRLTQRMDA